MGPAAPDPPERQRVVSVHLGGGVPDQEGAVGRVSQLLVHLLPGDVPPVPLRVLQAEAVVEAVAGGGGDRGGWLGGLRRQRWGGETEEVRRGGSVCSLTLR